MGGVRGDAQDAVPAGGSAPDPAHFARFLAESAEGARGCSHSKQRAHAFAAFSRPSLAVLPSPTGDETEAGVSAGIRRTRCGGHRRTVGTGAGRAQSPIARSPLRTIASPPGTPLGAHAQEAPKPCRPRSTGGGGPGGRTPPGSQLFGGYVQEPARHSVPPVDERPRAPA